MLDVPSFGLTLWHVLVVLTALALVPGRWRVSLVGLILLADWTLGTFAVPAQPDDGSSLCWWGYALIDLVAAVSVAALARDLAMLGVAALLWLSLCSHITAGVILFFNGSLALSQGQSWWDFNHWAAWLEAWALAVIMGVATHEFVGRWIATSVRGSSRPSTSFYSEAGTQSASRTTEGTHQ